MSRRGPKPHSAFMRLECLQGGTGHLTTGRIYFGWPAPKENGRRPRFYVDVDGRWTYVPADMMRPTNRNRSVYFPHKLLVHPSEQKFFKPWMLAA